MTFFVLLVLGVLVAAVLAQRWAWPLKSALACALTALATVIVFRVLPKADWSLSDDALDIATLCLLAALLIYGSFIFVRFVLRRRWRTLSKALVVVGAVVIVSGSAFLALVLFMNQLAGVSVTTSRSMDPFGSRWALPGHSNANGPSSTSSIQFADSPSRTAVSELILFVTMLLGMSSKYLWDQIELRRKLNARLRPGEARVGINFDFWDFVQPFLVGGIIFAAVIRLSSEVSFTNVLLGFQNGFFWQTVFRKGAVS